MNERRMFPQAPYDGGGGAAKKFALDYPHAKRKEMVAGWCGEGIDVDELVGRLDGEKLRQVQARIQADRNKNGPLIDKIQAEDSLIAKGKMDAPLPKVAEAWFLEGADPKGGVVGKGSKWYGEDAVVCRASVLDDVCRRVDAGVGFITEDPKTGEKRLSFLGVDVTVDNQGFESKFRQNLKDAAGYGTSSMYWYDADHDSGEEYVKPEEGIIPVVNTSVYVQDELLKKFMDPETESRDATELMRRFRPVLIRQQQLQLEMLAVTLLHDTDQLSIALGTIKPKTLTTRGKLIVALDKVPPQNAALVIIREALDQLWAIEKMIGGHGVVKNIPELKKQMPPYLANLDTLPVELPVTAIK